MQRFDSAGRALGGASPVNQVTTGPRSRPQLAVDPWSGDVVVTWVDERENGNPDIWMRRLSGDGAPRGPELRVETSNDGEALSAQPLVHGDGGFSVVWNKRVQTGPATFRIVVAAQRFDATASGSAPRSISPRRGPTRRRRRRCSTPGQPRRALARGGPARPG